MSKLEPLSDRVFIKPQTETTKLSSGFELSESARPEPIKGTVIAAGPGESRPMTVKEGDTVLYTPNAGVNINHGNESYLMLREMDIIAIIKE